MTFAFCLKNLQTQNGIYLRKLRRILHFALVFFHQRVNSPSLPPHAAVSTSKQNFDSRYDCIKKCRTMKTNNNISNRRGRASISSLNRIKRVILWLVGIISAILGLVLRVFLRPIFRGVGWVISLATALMIIFWLLTL